MDRLITSVELMPYYGFDVPEDTEELRRRKRNFQVFKAKNKALFPEPVMRGKWRLSDVVKKIESLNKPRARRQRNNSGKIRVG